MRAAKYSSWLIAHSKKRKKQSRQHPEGTENFYSMLRTFYASLLLRVCYEPSAMNHEPPFYS